MERYGVDKPDLRFGFEITPMSEMVKASGFSVFVELVAELSLPLPPLKIYQVNPPAIRINAINKIMMISFFFDTVLLNLFYYFLKYKLRPALNASAI